MGYCVKAAFVQSRRNRRNRHMRYALSGRFEPTAVLTGSPIFFASRTLGPDPELFAYFRQKFGRLSHDLVCTLAIAFLRSRTGWREGPL